MACTLSNIGMVMTSDYSVHATKNRFEGIFKSSGGRDKVVKLIKASADLAHVVKPTAESAKIAEATGTARDVFGLFNVLGGCLTSAYHAIINLGELLKNIWNDSEVPFHRPTAKGAEAELNKASKKDQKFLATIEQLGSGVGAITYSVAFGICRVIRFIGKIIGDLSAGAKKMVKAFAPIMFANHIGGILENGAGLWRRNLRMDELHKDAKALDPAYDLEFTKESALNMIGLGEKSLEIACDAQKVFGASIAALPMAIMGVGIGVCGVLKVFIGGYQAPKIPDAK